MSATPISDSVRIAWGASDTVFEPADAEYLDLTFPYSLGVRRVPEGSLFLQEEIPGGHCRGSETVVESGLSRAFCRHSTARLPSRSSGCRDEAPCLQQIVNAIDGELHADADEEEAHHTGHRVHAFFAEQFQQRTCAAQA